MQIKRMAGAWKGIALFVHQPLDFKDQLDFTTPVEALAGAALVGFELREL